MENTDFKNIRGTTDRADIKGWGIDADVENDPTYPMKKRTDEEIKGYTWQRPPLQPVTVEVLHSIERPNLTAVFGTSTPPSGLSGVIRRFAFKYSESSYGHWLPLIVADRVSVVEGIIEDIAHGRFPNIFAEKGGKAQWKYNRKAYVTKLAVTAVVVTAVALVLFSKKKKEESWLDD